MSIPKLSLTSDSFFPFFFFLGKVCNVFSKQFKFEDKGLLHIKEPFYPPPTNKDTFM